ncbi:VWA domain-containing protein [Microvirga tunisiensis]|uniref:VWA domain-containing protein n=1 Tax=Microvirga tunisiensis TaxID=2108360 RepID=A0A5N7MAY9_9HYPH|nr:VWA domain-containing protein [Microvirga tunisiensis]MPR23848.1 VWA domain-containing protein [Microvirga tunisiensis]
MDEAGDDDGHGESTDGSDEDDTDAREERIRQAAQGHEPEDQDRLDIGDILDQIGEIAEKLEKEGCIPSPTPIGSTVRLDRTLQGPSDLGHYNSARDRLAGVTSTLAGSLRSLVIARDVRRRSPNREEGQLDMRNITAIATMSPDIYARTTITRSNNTAITFLGDVSVSMTEFANDDDDTPINHRQSNPRRIDLYFDAKIALTEALGPARRVVTRYLAYTNHYNSIPLYLLKDFTDNIVTARAGIDRLMSQMAKSQFQMGGTPTGEAMLEAWSGMRARKEDKKILIVITDGEPNDGGLAERAAAMIKQEGGFVIGVSVGSQEPQFEMPFWVTVPTIQELPTKLLTALRPIL